MNIPGLIGLILATFGSWANAQPRSARPMGEFNAYLQSAEVVRRPHAPQCPNTLPPSGAMIFAFEGASGYSPRISTLFRAAAHALENTHDSHLRSEIQERLFMSMNYDPIRRKERSKSFQVKPAGLLGLVLSYLETQSTPGKDAADYLYYSKGHVKSAVECAKSLYTLAQHQGQPLSIRLMGFSMGGFSVLRMAERLEEDETPVDMVMTIDPVPKSVVGVARALFSSRDTRRIAKPDNVKRWNNYFQKIDSRSLLFGIKGSRVRHADLNQNIPVEAHLTSSSLESNREYLRASENTKQAHMWASFTDEVNAGLLELIAPVIQN